MRSPRGTQFRRWATELLAECVEVRVADVAVGLDVKVVGKDLTAIEVRVGRLRDRHPVRVDPVFEFGVDHIGGIRQWRDRAVLCHCALPCTSRQSWACCCVFHSRA
nr:virulence RhuM family protein [Cephaloticoccus capnophilus]